MATGTHLHVCFGVLNLKTTRKRRQTLSDVSVTALGQAVLFQCYSAFLKTLSSGKAQLSRRNSENEQSPTAPKTSGFSQENSVQPDRQLFDIHNTRFIPPQRGGPGRANTSSPTSPGEPPVLEEPPGRDAASSELFIYKTQTPCANAY